jgi:CDP-paratose synthetase
MTESILITGPTGFLGSRLVRLFTDIGRPVVIIAQKSADPWRLRGYLERIGVFYAEDDLEEPFQKHGISAVIHTATLYGRNNESLSQILEANCHFPLRVLEKASRHGASLFINTDTVLDKNTNAYARSKKQFTEWFPEFSRSMSFINLRLEHMYGEMDDYSKFIPYLIRELLTHAPEIKLTKGEQLRDFIHIDDVAAAYAAVVARGADYGPGVHEYDVGTGKPLSIRSVVELLKRAAGNTDTQLNFGALPYRENELLESKPDVERFFRDFQIRQPVPFAEGIQKTLEWYRTHL